MFGIAPISIDRTVDSDSEPIELAAAKVYLRVLDDDEENELIEGMITRARHTVEEATRRALWTGQTWQAGYDRIPCDRRFSIPKPPCVSVVSLQYYDSNNQLQTIPSDDYVLDASGRGRAVLSLKSTASIPTLSCDYAAPVRLNFTAGYADTDSMPHGLLGCVQYLIQHFYDNRSLVGINVNLNEMPKTFQYQIDQLKVPNRV